MKIYSIAIDGPAGSGKSTVAKILSEKLGIVYVDTGAMYRTAAYYCMTNGIDTKDGNAVAAAMEKINMDIKEKYLIVNNIVINKKYLELVTVDCDRKEYVRVNDEKRIYKNRKMYLVR